jgi:hypothetical protein
VVERQAAEPAAKIPFDIRVYWPYSTTDQWVTPQPELVTTAAITRYKLHEDTDTLKIFQWELQFTNTENYDYYFYDRTGDRYNVNTFRSGDHIIEFNSENPNIVRIVGR